MSVNLTKYVAQALDAQRRLLVGKGPPLELLRFDGQDEGGNRYASLKTLGSGYFTKSVRGDDGANFVEVEIADVDKDLAGILDPAAGEATDFACQGRVYKIEPDRTARPVSEPYLWTVRGYWTKDTFEA